VKSELLITPSLNSPRKSWK